MRKFSLLGSFFVCFSMFGLPVVAQTPDEITPAEETVCADETGAAKGLCSAYCEAMDCDNPNAQATSEACTQVRDNYEKITGSPPPCDIVCDECPDFRFGNFSSEVVDGTCSATGVVQCEVIRCGADGRAGVSVGDVFFSDQDATYNNGPFTSFNDACK